MKKIRVVASLSLLLVCISPMQSPAQPAAPVTVGADRLFTEYPQLIRGKRLALVYNHSGRIAERTHLADALKR